MPRSFLLKARDKEMVRPLVMKVRLFSLRQIASHWWAGEIANARRRLRVLTGAGLVSNLTVLARPLPELTVPVVSWQPGNPPPDFGAVAYTLQARWRTSAVRYCTAYVATPHAAQLFGGVGREKLDNPTQASHDLGVSAIWLLFHRQFPDMAEAWRGEDLMAHTRDREKRPDAFLVDTSGGTVGLIEFGGSYDAKRVAEFHADSQFRDLPYQLW